MFPDTLRGTGENLILMKIFYIFEFEIGEATS